MTTDHEAEQALAAALRSRAQSSGTPQLSLTRAIADPSPSEPAHRVAWFAVAACLVVAVAGAVFVLRASIGEDSTTAATTPVGPMSSQTPALDRATIRSLIADAEAYYGVKVGDPCPPTLELSPQVLFQPSVLNPEGGPCTVAAWSPNFTADGYSSTDLPLGDYDEDGTYHPPDPDSTVSIAASPIPLIIGLPECRDAGTAYEITDPDRVGQPGAPTYLYFGSDPADGVATLTYAKDSAARADLQAPGVQRQTTWFDDATFTVSWMSNNEPVALLSGKRIDATELTALADAVETGAVASTGFNEVPPPDQGAHVFGHSCTTESGFLAVEVLEGSVSAQAMYLLNTDPTQVEPHGDALVLTYNRSNPGVPVPIAPVSAAEFDSMVASSEARGGP